MDKQLKRKDLVLVKWNSKYMTDREGCTRINDSSYKNSRITVGDITTENVGMLNGKPVIFDPEAAYNEDIIRMSNTKFKNK